jgi:hypothetical protein
MLILIAEYTVLICTLQARIVEQPISLIASIAVHIEKCFTSSASIRARETRLIVYIP